MTNDPKSLDILGIKPIADSIKKVTDATVDGVSAFLSRICLPAAKEFGLLLRDRVRGWRAANIAAVVSVAEKRHDAAHAGAEVHAHPRIVRHIVEEASWMDDPVVQDLWGGLLASSCTETGDDESNLIYINLLSGLTKLQARLLKYLCESTPKRAAENGLIFPVHQSTLTLDTITEITGEPDIHRLDSEIDNLRGAGLIEGGFEVYSSSTIAYVTPTALALYMYVRCQGVRTSPIDYFGIRNPEE